MIQWWKSNLTIPDIEQDNVKNDQTQENIQSGFYTLS